MLILPFIPSLHEFLFLLQVLHTFLYTYAKIGTAIQDHLFFFFMNLSMICTRGEMRIHNEHLKFLYIEK